MEIRTQNPSAALVSQTYNYLPSLWKKFPDPVAHFQTGMHFGMETKKVTWDFDQFASDQNLDDLELLQITDVQHGHVECQVNREIEYRDWILAKPNRFMFWGGDMIDAWALWSPGMPWENLMAPDSQLYQFCEIWAPAQNRIIGFVGGNHERRAVKGYGDLGLLIATMMKLPYSRGKQLVDIKFGDHQPFKTTLWHGSGGSVTKGAVAQVLDRFMQQGDSQLYLMGHLHQPLIIPNWREVRTKNGLRLEKIIGAVGSSFLQTWGTYAEIKGLRSSDVMMARAVIERNGHWEVTLR